MDTQKNGCGYDPQPNSKGIDTMSISHDEMQKQPMTLKDWALMYAANGWRVIPIIPGDKRPTIKGWQKAASTDPKLIERWWRATPNAGIGLVTGGQFEVLDFDLNLSGNKEYGKHPEIWEMYKELMLQNPVVRTQNGYHVYFSSIGSKTTVQIGPETGEVNEKGKPRRACDWRGIGGFVVAPPTPFIDGTGHYTWLVPPKDRPFSEPTPLVMDWLNRRNTSAKNAPADKPTKTNQTTISFVRSDDRQNEAYFAKALEGLCSDMSNAVEGERNHTLYTCACRLQELLNGSCGNTSAASGAMEKLIAAASAAGLEDREINTTINSARTKVGNFGVEPNLNTQERVSFEVQGQDTSWEHLLFRLPDKKDGTPGALQAVAANVKTILLHDPRWKGKIVHNEFSRAVEKIGRVPSETGHRQHDEKWTDNDDAEFVDWLSHEYGVHYKNMDEMRRGVLAAALTNNYHPVRQYLNGLKWDGKERITDIPRTLFGCDNPDYSGKVFKWIVMQAVNRIFVPGCKADYVLILEGAQGIGKSTIAAVLGGEWFSDSPIDMTSKDAYSQTIGTWIVEIPELSGFSKTDDTRAKSFFSERAPRVRLPFRRDAEKIPRECIFIGTTNENDYLKDSTGNRRYFPIKCGVTGPIRIDELKKLRDQIFAEAVARVRRGERSYPTSAEENEMLTLQQSTRMLDDAWSYPVQAWLRKQLNDVVIPSEVFKGALDKPIGTVTTGDSRRLAAILKKLGYESTRITMDGKKVTVYKKALSAQLPTLDIDEDIPY